MHDTKKNLLFSALALVLILSGSAAAQLTTRAEDMQSKWRASVLDDVNVIEADYLDKEKVVVVGANKTVYVFDEDGRQMANYTLPTEGKVYAVAVGDIDGDWKDEILAGTGWQENEEIPFMDLYPGADLPPEDVDLLYMILKSRGSLYVIDDGKITAWPEVDQWVRTIALTDVNGDRMNETVIVSGGYQKNYYKTYTTIFYPHWDCETEVDYDRTYKYPTEAACTTTCPNCVWENSSCYVREVVEECDWNYTEDKGWNLSETSTANASIFVYSWDKKLLSKSPIKGVNAAFLNAQVVNLYRDNDEEVIFGTNDSVYIVRQNGEVTAKYAQKTEVRHMYAADCNGDGNDDLVFGFRNTTGYGVKAMDRAGILLWTYFINETTEAPVTYVKNARTHGVSEAFLSLAGVFYVVDNAGELAWTSRFVHQGSLINKISMLLSTDLDSDDSEDILVVSGRVIYDFEVVGAFIHVQRAEKYIAQAEDAYERNMYQEAKGYAENAKQLYSEAKHSEGLLKAETLLTQINAKLSGTRRDDAEAQYAKALTSYGRRDFSKAREYVSAAKAIYYEVGDAEGISRCDALIKTIDEKLGTTRTTGATTATTKTTSTTLSEGIDFGSMLSQYAPILGAVAVVVLLLVIGAASMKNKSGKSPKGKKSLYGLEVSEKEQRGGKTVEVKLKGGQEKAAKPQEKAAKGAEKPAGLKQEWDELEEKWKKLGEI
jgi:hypothetical protein